MGLLTLLLLYFHAANDHICVILRTKTGKKEFYQIKDLYMKAILECNFKPFNKTYCMLPLVNLF